MDLYTLNRKFLRQDSVDGFVSAIWTERYYGDSEVELVVPATAENVKKYPEGIFLSLAGSDEVMIVETANIEEGNLKLSGIALLPWMNNRFVRSSPKHDERSWSVTGGTPGSTLWAIIYNMCHKDSPYLNGTVNTGIPNPQNLAIPGLALDDYDKSGPIINVSVPFGPVYDAMREIATTFEIGMRLRLVSADDNAFVLGFRSYKGLDRTSGQTQYPPVRFSPQMDSLTNIKELRSIAALKTAAYAFTSSAPSSMLSTPPGVSVLSGSQYTGFDLRALQVFADDITTDAIGGSTATLLALLNSRAADGLNNNHYVKAVDGEIVPTNQFQYGVHYNLGDIIEVQGNSEIVQTSRVTEYIRAQDEAGEKAYPTVAMLN